MPAPLDRWRLKYRFHFEEVAAAAAPPKNLFRVWWSTEATNNEYSVPQSAADCDDPATPSEQCVHTIRSAFEGRDMVVNPGSTNNACMVTNDPNACGDEKRIAASGGEFELVYAAGHCHAPACLSMELWDADRNELLCRNEPTIGAGQGVHDEKGFVVGIAPCVWGAAADGLRPPPRVRLDGNYTSIKRVNSTHGHWGVMALWQMRGAYAD